MEWFKNTLAGPLAMLIITSLSAGVWMLVVLALENKSELHAREEFMRHSLQTDAKLAAAIQLLSNGQIEIRLKLAESKVEFATLRRDVEELKRKLNK